MAGRKTTVQKVPLSETVPGPTPRAAATAEAALTWASLARVRRTGPSVPPSSSCDHRCAVLGGLARPVDGLGHAEPQVTLQVDAGEAEVRVGQPAQLAYCVVGRALARGDLFDQRTKRRSVHDLLYPAQL